MPLLMLVDAHLAMENIAQYPAKIKQAAANIDGILTNVTSTLFTDKIMIIITQDGRLAQWVPVSPFSYLLTLLDAESCFAKIHVPLDTPDPNFSDQHVPTEVDEDSLLPMSHLSPHTLLGSSTSERETVGQLFATQIASAIVSRNPDEKRTILLGLGLKKAEVSRETFYDMIDLVQRCL